MVDLLVMTLQNLEPFAGGDRTSLEELEIKKLIRTQEQGRLVVDALNDNQLNSLKVLRILE